MSDITHIANVKNDNKLINPVELLHEVIRDIEAGVINPNSMIILPVTHDGNKFNVNFYMSNLNSSLAVAASRCFETQMLQCMNYIPDYDE